MGTENAAASGGVSGLAAQFGIVPTFAGGPSGDPDDFEVITGRERRAPRGGVVGGGRGGEYTAEEESQFLYGGMPSDYTREFPTLKRSSELEKEFYAKPQTDVAELQRRLWAGGFYPPGANPEEIVLGDYDDYTFKAWQSAITRAGRFKSAGQDYTLDEVIDMGANLEGAGKARGGGAGGSGGLGRAPLVVELANPEDLKYYAQRTAVATLGRGLKPDELERFVASFHGSQQASQAQAYGAGGAGGPGGSVVGAPTPAAAAEAFARQEAPVEAGAHDAVKVFDAMSKLLGGKRGRG